MFMGTLSISDVPIIGHFGDHISKKIRHHNPYYNSMLVYKNFYKVGTIVDQ